MQASVLQNILWMEEASALILCYNNKNINKEVPTLLSITESHHLMAFQATISSTLTVHEMSDAQKVALEILVQWGDKRPDAQRWITAAVENEKMLTKPEDIVRAAYRVKHGAT